MKDWRLKSEKISLTSFTSFKSQLIPQKQMTREEVLKIVMQNRDILTPENYLRILKNVDILSDKDKENIVAFLQVSKEMLEVNKIYVQRRNALYQKAGEEFKQMGQDMKDVFKKAEEDEENRESDKADDLLANL